LNLTKSNYLKKGLKKLRYQIGKNDTHQIKAMDARKMMARLPAKNILKNLIIKYIKLGLQIIN